MRQAPDTFFVRQHSAPVGLWFRDGGSGPSTAPSGGRAVSEWASDKQPAQSAKNFRQGGEVNQLRNWATQDTGWQQRGLRDPYQEDVQQKQRKLPRVLANRLQGHSQKKGYVVGGMASKGSGNRQLSLPNPPRLASGRPADELDKRLRVLQHIFAETEAPVQDNKSNVPLSARLEELAKPRIKFSECEPPAPLESATPLLPNKRLQRKEYHVPSVPARFQHVENGEDPFAPKSSPPSEPRSPKPTKSSLAPKEKKKKPVDKDQPGNLSGSGFVVIDQDSDVGQDVAAADAGSVGRADEAMTDEAGDGYDETSRGAAATRIQSLKRGRDARSRSKQLREEKRASDAEAQAAAVAAAVATPEERMADVAVVDKNDDKNADDSGYERQTSPASDGNGDDGYDDDFENTQGVQRANTSATSATEDDGYDEDGFERTDTSPLGRTVTNQTTGDFEDDDFESEDASPQTRTAKTQPSSESIFEGSQEDSADFEEEARGTAAAATKHAKDDDDEDDGDYGEGFDEDDGDGLGQPRTSKATSAEPRSDRTARVMASAKKPTEEAGAQKGPEETMCVPRKKVVEVLGSMGMDPACAEEIFYIIGQDEKDPVTLEKASFAAALLDMSLDDSTAQKVISQLSEGTAAANTEAAGAQKEEEAEGSGSEDAFESDDAEADAPEAADKEPDKKGEPDKMGETRELQKDISRHYSDEDGFEDDEEDDFESDEG